MIGIADGAGVVVAVVDSGVDATYPQLAGATIAGVDVLDAGGDGRLDCVGHGTAVASIIAARPRRGSGLVGIAPAATIMPVRVSERSDDSRSDTGRSATTTAVADAIRTAVDRGARVVNLSLTTDRDDPALRDAIQHAVKRNVVIVAAAGNKRESGNLRMYPAAYPGVLGVGAVGPDGARTDGSQTGDHIDLLAPGADVTAGGRGGGHSRYTGTSFAAAFVSGAAALVRQYHPKLTAAEVAARLTATADPAAGGPIDAVATNRPGIVNPYRAVTGWVPDAVAGAAGTPVPLDRARAASWTDDPRTRLALWLAAAGTVAALLIGLVGSALRRRAARHGPANVRRTGSNCAPRYAGSRPPTRQGPV